MVKKLARKSPVRHKVRSHTRNMKKVKSYTRGSGKTKLSKPTIGKLQSYAIVLGGQESTTAHRNIKEAKEEAKKQLDSRDYHDFALIVREPINIYNPDVVATVYKDKPKDYKLTALDYEKIEEVVTNSSSMDKRERKSLLLEFSRSDDPIFALVEYPEIKEAVMKDENLTSTEKKQLIKKLSAKESKEKMIIDKLVAKIKKEKEGLKARRFTAVTGMFSGPFIESDRDVQSREMSKEVGFKLKRQPSMITHHGRTFYHFGRHGKRTFEEARNALARAKLMGHHINESAIVKIGRSYHIYLW